MCIFCKQLTEYENHYWHEGNYIFLIFFIVENHYWLEGNYVLLILFLVEKTEEEEFIVLSEICQS